MSNQKNVQIIGGGLCGCLTAYQVAKRHPDYRVDLIEAGDSLVSAFNPIFLGGRALNNGFHGLELPRSDGLFDFFVHILGLNLRQKINRRLLSIKGHLVPYDALLSEWPDELQQNFLVKPPFEADSVEDFWPLVSNSYRALLELAGTRYSQNVDNISGLLIPWFFPADYILNSADEGAIYRNNVRSKSVTAMYGHPEGHLFGVVQDAIRAKLEEMGVHLHLSTKASFKGQGIEFLFPDDAKIDLSREADFVFFCASSAIMLKDINSGMFDELTKDPRGLYGALLEISNPVEIEYFSEIICLDEGCHSIGRISSPDGFGHRLDHDGKLIQVELFVDPALDVNKIEAELPFHIARILKLSKANTIKLLEMKKTNQLYNPNKELLKHAETEIDNWIEKNCPNLVTRPNFGPINMAKTWNWSIEFADLICGKN